METTIVYGLLLVSKKFIFRLDHYVKSAQIRSIFWTVVYHIWTEYEELRCISPYPARIWGNNDRKILHIWIFFT